ncbi:MAG: DUF5658 family protein [Planctomycetota bacterium]
MVLDSISRRPIAGLCFFTFLSIGLIAPAAGQSPVDASILIEEGFLFVDGRYVPTPIEIEVRGDSLAIQGTEYASDYFRLPEEEERGARSRSRSPRVQTQSYHAFNRGNGVKGGRSKREQKQRAAELQGLLRDLRLGFVAVLYEGESPLLLDPTGTGQDLLETLTSDEQLAFIAPSSLNQDEQKLWLQIVSEFESTPQFQSQAMAVLNENWRAQQVNEQVVAANLFFDRVSYPITMTAMILVVLAFGHLLANSPNHMAPTDDPEKASHAHGTILKSLCLIGLLSAIDLFWTLAASQAGAMREMNPLGRAMIEDPLQLILFKAGVTGLAIGILYWLHRFPIAQRASWWCCLVLTLLTARWLTFQSMFV